MDGLETRSVFPADLEYRQRGRLILGFFPYGHPATISDRGRVRKEQFAARAFQYAVDTPDHRVDLLRGHDFDNPLASKQAGTLKLEDSDAGLNFRATLPPEKRQPTWMRDTVLALGAGLLSGISPGFKLPPRNRIAKAEEEVPEKGNPGRVRAADSRCRPVRAIASGAACVLGYQAGTPGRREPGA